MPSPLTIQVRIPLTATVFAAKFVFEKKENKQKTRGLSILNTLDYMQSNVRGVKEFVRSPSVANLIKPL